MTRIIANGLGVNVAEIGAPDHPAGPVVLVHGLAGDSLASWYFTLAPRIAPTGRRVVMYDLRGHGSTETPSSGYRFDDFVTDLAELTDQISPDAPVTLIGNSFGAPISFGLAARRPDRVAGVAALDSGLPTTEMFALAGHLRLADRKERFLRAAESPESVPANVARRARRIKRLLHETTFEADLRVSAENPPDPRTFTAITQPVLCVFGGESEARRLVPETSRWLPQARIVVIAGARHSLLFTHTDRVAAEISTWLADTSPSSSRR